LKSQVKSSASSKFDHTENKENESLNMNFTSKVPYEEFSKKEILSLKPQPKFSSIRPAGESSEESQLMIENQPFFGNEPSTGGSPIKEQQTKIQS
jgi:hypothetical protein